MHLSEVFHSLKKIAACGSEAVAIHVNKQKGAMPCSCQQIVSKAPTKYITLDQYKSALKPTESPASAFFLHHVKLAKFE
jgi:hypothetical protein